MASRDTGVNSKERKSAWVDDDQTEEKTMAFAELWKDFSQNTGFHAFNKLNPGRRYIRFFWWTFVVMGMAVYLMYNVAAELNNYYSYPKMTEFYIEMRDRMEFPAVTICNQCPLNATAMEVDFPMANYFLSKSPAKDRSAPVDWNDTEAYGDFYTTEYSVDWWRDKYGQIDQLLRLCNFQGLNMACSELFEPVFTEVGLCYTFNGNTSNRRNVSLSGADNNLVVMLVTRQNEYVYNEQMSAGYKVLLHEPHEHPDSVRSGILAGPGFSTYVSIKKKMFTLLPSPFKAFGESECVDTSSPSFNNSLKYHQHYTYEHCLLECAADFLFSQCGCVMPNDPPLGPICSLKAQSLCYWPSLKSLRTSASAQAICRCSRDCVSTKYSFQVSMAAFPSNLWTSLLVESKFLSDWTYAKDNALEIRIFYDQLMIEKVEQVPIYKTSTIVANLGGQMGICLGASILTLTELGEFLLFSFFYIFHRFKRANDMKRTSSQ